MILKYTSSGHIFLSSEDDPEAVLDAIIATNYDKEICLALDFNPDFIASLMRAGFLIMSEKMDVEIDSASEGENYVQYVVEPEHHLIRSAMFFENLHINRSVKRFINRYEFRADTDFEYIIDRCVEVHGDGWLTKPLVAAIKQIKTNGDEEVKPFSFGVYRDGKLAAGEFGVMCGKVYTSYSGYRDESQAGKVQMILTAKYLKDNNFAFWDLGMPLQYKTDLGAVNISIEEFVRIYRAAQS